MTIRLCGGEERQSFQRTPVERCSVPFSPPVQEQRSVPWRFNQTSDPVNRFLAYTRGPICRSGPRRLLGSARNWKSAETFFFRRYLDLHASAHDKLPHGFNCYLLIFFLYFLDCQDMTRVSAHSSLNLLHVKLPRLIATAAAAKPTTTLQANALQLGLGMGIFLWSAIAG